MRFAVLPLFVLIAVAAPHVSAAEPAPAKPSTKPATKPAGDPKDAKMLASIRALHTSGKVSQAADLAGKRVTYREKKYGAQSAPVVAALGDWAFLLEAARRHPEEIKVRVRRIELMEKLLGKKDPPDIAVPLFHLGKAYTQVGGHADALKAFQRSLPLTRKLHGAQSIAAAYVLRGLAVSQAYNGAIDAAEKTYAEALAIFVAKAGPDHMQTARTAADIVGLLSHFRRDAKAIPYAKQAFDIYTRKLGPTHVQTLFAQASYAETLGRGGKVREALEVAKSLAAAAKKVPTTPQSTFPLRVAQVRAAIFQRAGRYIEAYKLRRVAMGEIAKRYGKKSLAYAQAVNFAALNRRLSGDNPGAVGMYRDAIAILEALGDDGQRDLAVTLDNMANAMQDSGDVQAARPVSERAGRLWLQLDGPDGVHTATHLNNYAMILRQLGDFSLALDAMRKALAATEKKLGSKHTRTATLLDNIGALLAQMGRFDEAETYHERARAGFVALYGPEHVSVATSLQNLGYVHRQAGRADKALGVYDQARRVYLKRLGKKHPSLASLDSLVAGAWLSLGKPKKAVKAAKSAIKLDKLILGGRPHARLASNHTVLAQAYAQMNKTKPMQKHALKALGINQAIIEPILYTASERERLTMVATNRFPVGAALTLLDREENAASMYEGVLRFKALALGSLVDQREKLRAKAKSPKVAAKLNALSGVRNALSSLAFVMPEAAKAAAHAKRVASLSQRKNVLERELSALSNDFAQDTARQKAGLSELCAALKPGEFLVDYVRFEPVARELQKRKSKSGKMKVVPVVSSRQAYAAFVLVGGDCKRPRRVSLGAAKAVDEAVGAFRKAIEKGAGSDETIPLLRWVRRVAWDPVETVIKTALGGLEGVEGVPVIRLVLDGSLNGIPFGTLPVGSGEGGGPSRFMVERYRFAYLASARDLLGLKKPGAPTVGKQTKVVVGGVNYDAAASAMDVVEDSAKRDRDVKNAQNEAERPEGVASRAAGCGGKSMPRFTYLPGTKTEARSVLKAVGALQADGKVAPGTRFLLGAGANETAVRAAFEQATSIHLATHGFFAKGCKSAMKGRGASIDQSQVSGLNPLVLSGLALAGANKGDSARKVGAGERDGILTAEEVASMDLSKVEMAVLSACETGLGDVKDGQGVLGLRWAFAVAGVRSLVMSLWKVPDEGTRKLMEAFYKVDSKLPVSVRMRRAQLKILRTMRKDGDADPWSWGAFIVSGN